MLSGVEKWFSMGLIGRSLYLIVRIEEILMLVRAVMSWIMPGDASKLSEFLYNVTEPIISPFRRLLLRIPFCRDFPIDLSFLLAFVVLELLGRVFLIL